MCLFDSGGQRYIKAINKTKQNKTVVVIGNEDDKHKVPLKNKYMAVTFLCFCASLFQVVWSSNCENVKSARHERVKQTCPLL